MGRLFAVLLCFSLYCFCGDLLLLVGGKPEQKRYAGILQARLADCGIECKSRAESDVKASDISEASVVILPNTGRLGDEIRGSIASYVAGGGKMLAFYDADAAVLKHLGIAKLQYELHKPGSIQGVSFENDMKILAAFPGRMAHRTNSVMNPALQSGTLAIGHWLDGKGTPLGIAATLNKNGIYFGGVYLDQDAVNGGDFLMAVLAVYEPDVWRGIAAKLQKTSLSFAGSDTAGQLNRRIAQCGKKELGAMLAQAISAKKAGDALHKQKKFPEAVKQYRKADGLGSRIFMESAMARPGELRGVWCHSAYGVPGYGWDEVVRALAANGFNALFLNACWADLADYPSSVLMNAPDVAEKGDQIALCLEACRKYGVELHVWRVCWNLGHRYPADKLAAMQAAKRTQKAANGEDSAFLAPHIAANLALELDAIEEIARKYKVDGIHLDYIRYSSSRFDYSDGAKEAFEASLGKRVEAWPGDCQAGGTLFNDFCAWRCNNISKLVKGAKERIAKAGAKAKLSVAVYPEWNNSPEWIGQDVRTWIDNGWVDFICPMDYSADMDEYSTWLQAQYDYNQGRVPVYIGISLYKLKGNVPALQQIEEARKLGHDGIVCFDLKKGFLEEQLPQLGKGPCSRKVTALPHNSRGVTFHVPFGERLLDGAFRQGATIFIDVDLPEKVCDKDLSVSLELDGVNLGGRGISAHFTQKGLRLSLTAENAGRYRLRIEKQGFVARSPIIRSLSRAEVKEVLARKGPPQFSNNGGINVGVWHDGAYGAQPILEALQAKPGIDAAILYNTEPENMAECKVIVLPQVRRKVEFFRSEEAAKALRGYVRNGGALMLTHAMVGTRQFPNLFPDVVKSVNQVPLRERNWRYAHPHASAVSKSSFVDMIEMEAGKDGTRYLKSESGKCIMVVGEVAKGRYAACGLGLGIGKADKDTPLSSQE
ncbi:MAG: family 10 glycosylhydrolase, partial [Victivallales bacterium]|nr:family 10 glycosylhydrolase [Victivallales bacterium]